MSRDQDLQRAFERVAVARDAIAGVVASVASAQVTLAEAFARADADPLVGRVFAVKVIEVVPGVGKVAARRTLAALDVPDGAALAELAPDRRQRILAAIGALVSPDGI